MISLQPAWRSSRHKEIVGTRWNASRPAAGGRTTARLALAWLLVQLFVGALRGQLPPDFAPIYSPAGSGAAYAHARLTTTNGPWSVHIVRLGWPRPDLEVVSTLAEGTVFGLSTMTEQVKATATPTRRPLVAINGDFFVIRHEPYQGDPRGLQLRDGELVSAPTGEVAVWFEAAGRPRLGRVRSRMKVRWPDGTETPLGLNQQRATNAAVLYTPTLGASTRTVGGVELVLVRAGQSAWLPLRAEARIRARVLEVRSGGNTPLRAGQMVLSLGPNLVSRAAKVTPGTRLELSTATSAKLSGLKTAIAGGPALVEAGTIPGWKPPQPRHSRTALGWNDAHLFLVVVDGRQPALSVGMTMPELAELMQRLGCRDALNLDGGGSSTLWLDGKLVNSPSDGWERAVANGLVVVQTRGSGRR